ncbi:MAG: alpha/beta fold hydrolase [bacterium]|nr:alpha/beta fold hydrolase [bacterium]
MKKKLRGIKRKAIQLDFDLYRVEVPIHGLANTHLSVIDLWPESVEHTIMFVHGYAGCAETWEFQINHFARDYRVVVPDLRGHGQSDAPYTQYTMAEIVDDLHTIVETLQLPEKFILVGHSFGGSICVEYANAHPERLEKLVLVATAGEYPLPRVAAWAYRMPTAFYRLWWDYRPRWNAEIHVMKRMMFNNMRKWKGWPLLRNIRTETLVITGERDNYFPRYVFEDAARMIPNAEIYDVGSAKHKVQLERAEAVNRAIERFISDQRKGSWREHSLQAARLIHQRPWLTSYSKETPRTIPIPRQPLHRFLESAAEWVPKHTATIFYESTLSYQQLNARVNQFAHALHGLGVRPGDRVMIVLPNLPQLVIAYYATLKIGGVVVMPNPDAPDTQAHNVIKQILQTQAKVLVTVRTYAELAKTLKAQDYAIHVVFADQRESINDENFSRLLSTDPESPLVTQTRPLGLSMTRLMEEASEATPHVQIAHTDLAAIVFTSGTTDDPKGVRLTHENLVANTLQTRHWVPDLDYGKEVFLSVLPMMHSYGMTGALNVPIAMGATLVLLPVFELQQVLDHIKTYKPTLFPGVPAMYTVINRAPNVRNYGLSSIKACVSGAAPLPVEVQEAFEKLTRGRLVEGYGLTECSPVTHANPLYGVRKVGSIGVPLPNTDAKIVDLATGETLPPGEIGELAVRGPQVMDGYWAESVEDEPESVQKDGWLFTGDVAVMDEDGYFQIISRKRDTIIVDGTYVYPRDVEEVLYENNKVLEAAVIGVPDATRGQIVKAFVVPRQDATLTEAELIALCQRRLDAHAVPSRIEFRRELPKSFVGKVLRRLLVEEDVHSH